MEGATWAPIDSPHAGRRNKEHRMLRSYSVLGFIFALAFAALAVAYVATGASTLRWVHLAAACFCVLFLRERADPAQPEGE